MLELLSKENINENINDFRESNCYPESTNRLEIEINSLQIVLLNQPKPSNQLNKKKKQLV